MGIYYLVFISVDLLGGDGGLRHGSAGRLAAACSGCRLQRFGYRQLMYYVVLRSISTAIRGSFVGWGKLERHGTVKTGPAFRTNA